MFLSVVLSQVPRTMHGMQWAFRERRLNERVCALLVTELRQPYSQHLPLMPAWWPVSVTSGVVVTSVPEKTFSEESLLHNNTPSAPREIPSR